MPPKTGASKKRKNPPSSTQTTLTSYKIQSQPPPNKINKDVEPLLPSFPIQSMAVNRGENQTINVSSILGSFRSHSLVDKITVNNFKDSQSRPLSDEDFDEAWKKLKCIIDDVLYSTQCKTSVQVAYELCGDLCRFGKPEELYNHVKDELICYVRRKAEELEELANNDSGFLHYLNSRWIKLNDHLIMIRNIFMELDRRYVMRATSYSSLVQVGKELFRTHVMSRDVIKKQLISDVLLLIQKERDGSTIETDVLRSLLQMMVELTLYSNEFEPAFMEQTVAYYRSEGTNLLAELDVSQYLIHVKRRREEEGTVRVNTYLSSTTKSRLVEAVTEQLVYTRISVILSKGFDNMMENCQKEPLGILYETLLPSNDLQTLRTAFAEYVKIRGTSFMGNATKDSQLVETLLQHKAKMDDIIASCFRNDAKFNGSLKESFESFINQRQNKPAELIAKFIDSKLRSSGKKFATGEDLEELIDQVLVLFRYLQGKDTFEAFYKRFLAKRLLLNRSISTDVEKHILAKLKAECGPDFTKNLEAMLKDVEVSADLNMSFKTSNEYREQGSMNIYINVLAQGVWPSYSISDVMLPHEMLEYQRAFERFYTSKFKGRRLVWRSSLGTCSVKANFPLATKELTVSLSQASVLLLFNDLSKSEITYSEIMQMTSLDEKELIRVLQSLSCGHHKILNKHLPGTAIESGDTFSYNSEFQAAPYRIKINTIQQEQTVEERKDVQSKVQINRQHQVEAAIVRIMKAKKKMSHAVLVSELFMNLKFPIDAADIKKRIESLIDRDYLSRDENDNSTYIYQS